jgi:nickel transport protein
MHDIWRAFLATLLLVALPLTSASAHRLRAFAFAEGAVIHGSVYFGSNGPAQGAHIRALDPNGALMAETTSDANGRFSIVAHRRVDYRIVADSGDSHVAEFTVTATELPDSLASAADPEPLPAAAAPSQVDPAGVAGASNEALEAMIERAVARQVGPLREQLAGYEDTVRWHDVLGGLGYILGITGIACYLIGRHNRQP